MRVGIPRALLFFQYYPMWKVFFEELGAEVITTGRTNKKIVDEGVRRTVNDTCFPIKVLTGHVVELSGVCDALFLPSIRSLREGSYNCSKFLGLPDITRALVPEAPEIIEADIEIPKGKRDLYIEILKVGRRFTANPIRIKRASERAWKAYKEYRKLMREERLTPPEAMDKLYGKDAHGWKRGRITIGIVGHPYVLYDEFINHNILKKLRDMDVSFLTPEMIPEEEACSEVMRLVGRFYWTYEDEVTGAGGCFIKSPDIDGVICFVPFGCGPDSLMTGLLKTEAKRVKKPFMILSFDEHTAEAGIITRLEAFIDMILRRGG